MTRILLLAGTGEARSLAGHLAEMPGLEVTASLAGATTAPATLPCRVRTGGFGGRAGLADWLTAHRIDLLIDATHPYATQMQANAAGASAATGVPRLRIQRPPWPEEPGWTRAHDIPGAAAALPARARVFLTTGRKEIAPFAARADVWFALRSIEPAAGLPSHIEQVRGRPPFSVEAEKALFALLGITHLVSKNAGGGARAKLDAARALGISVVMVERPDTAAGPVVERVDEAVAWVASNVATR